MQLQPPYLQPGDSVYLLSTARKISISECEFAIQVLESWGLRVLIGKTIGAEENQFAGSDKLRLMDFQDALENIDVKAIICARGGYGTVRMMDGINWNTFVEKPKWIVGFSDITFLLNHVSNYFGICSLHASMPISFPSNSPEAISSLRLTLMGENVTYQVAGHPLNKPGETQAELCGGNLSIIHSMTGTLSGINTHGRILFLEDLDEYLYHIDRMMMNLKRGGKLQSIAGLIVGGFTEMKDNNVSFGKTAEEIILEYVSGLNIPVCFGFPAGHMNDNRALIIGKTYSLKVEWGNVFLR